MSGYQCTALYSEGTGKGFKYLLRDRNDYVFTFGFMIEIFYDHGEFVAPQTSQCICLAQIIFESGGNPNQLPPA